MMVRKHGCMLFIAVTGLEVDNVQCCSVIFVSGLQGYRINFLREG